MFENSVLFLGILSYLLVSSKQILSKLFNSILMRCSASVTVTSQQKEIYSNISVWLRELNCRSLENNSGIVEHYVNGEKIILHTINYGEYIIRVNACIISIHKELIDTAFTLYDKLTIRLYGFYGNHYKSLLQVMTVDKHEGMLRVFPSANTWRLLRTPSRSFDTIFNPEKEKIIRHLDGWLGRSDMYRSLGLTYKTGILLYGEPGTGKSSLIRAIASYLKYDLHIINLSEYEKASDLIVKLTDLHPNICVVFEDIDCILKNREEEGQKLLEVVLNVLDGMMSPEGIVFLATTNFIDQLDSALIRYGRFDCKVHIQNIEYVYAQQLCNNYGVSEDILEGESFPINPAYLQQKCLMNISNV